MRWVTESSIAFQVSPLGIPKMAVQEDHQDANDSCNLAVQIFSSWILVSGAGQNRAYALFRRYLPSSWVRDGSDGTLHNLNLDSVPERPG